MLMPPGSPIPQATRRGSGNPAARRARQVIALGLMKKGAGCASPGMDSTVPYASALQMTQALTPADVAAQAVLMARSTVSQGQSGSLDSTVPLAVAIQMSQALSPAAVKARSSAMGPATVAQGQSGANAADPSQFSDAPIILPMNVSPEMAVQASPQALMDRRRRRKQSLAETSYRSPGVPWGGAPALQPGTACGPSAGTFLEQLRANPLAALLIASGLGVMVYAVANRK